MLFIKGSGACPQCGTALRRNNYRLQVFEDATVEKEVDIRKRILRDFNKKEEDFPDLRSYNDYLEMIETVVFNLTNGVDVESTRKLIEQYKKENKDYIKKNQSKLSRDEEYLEQLIEQEKHETAIRRQLAAEEEQGEKNTKRRNKDALIDDLMFSDLTAQAILDRHKKVSSVKEEEQKPPTFSTGIRIQNVYTPMDETTEPEPYVYVPIVLETNGPPFPTLDDIFKQGYLANVRNCTPSERAGGFEPHIACQRALMDAMSGLFYFPAVHKPSPETSLAPTSHGPTPSPMYIS
ncbi:hypothetical protein C0Q70_14336 [Pomacea canaliculata]|uniref:Uncharacterized protein n=2 Tax=Pomacea canaliculata TaxID=400727 RepID=A0A2T7NZQ9_POMCA|nr:hypothetical protein C0Q70_14336 [Pomacea canaliculata]